ncbi:Outer membrane protein MxiD [Pandoraea terrae]|uniref:Type 3 secretion system secretin n=1 Tax=Pandoraea terrae TaxID=1537710 RepID=A0A5E4T8P0_9BURK|nr:Outer membrane protein MxiD [Pandoraea terrae]
MCMAALALSGQAFAQAGLQAAAQAPAAGYVANNDGLRTFFDALSERLRKPIIVSKLASRKQVTGDFKFDDPKKLLDSVALSLGLIWYHDGQAIYVYDAGEMRNATVSLRNASYDDIVAYLDNAGLADRRYPLRGDRRAATFYVSGPPVYVDLVVNAATMMDRVPATAASLSESVEVVRLHHASVADRTYDLRNQKIVVPGLARTLTALLAAPSQAGARVQDDQARLASVEPDGTVRTDPGQAKFPPAHDGETEEIIAEGPNVAVVAYSDANSLLVRGSASDIALVKTLASRLDVAKRHIELSLWIIDVNKQAFDAMGVQWSGGLNVGGRFGVTLNSTASVTTLDGARFLASIHALASQGDANIVSRPVVLAQDNVPALFDNSETTYVPLLAERSTDLREITFGTMISVWPRFTPSGEVQMSLNIEDGGKMAPPGRDGDRTPPLPIVSRTHISTVARVPKGKSLLVGGYTRDRQETSESKLPLLGDLPLIGGLFRFSSVSRSNSVRLFLIEPREIDGPLTRDASDLSAQVIRATDPSPDALQQDVRAALSQPGAVSTNPERDHGRP